MESHDFRQKRIKLENESYEYDAIIKQETEETLPHIPIDFDPSITEFKELTEKDYFIDKTLLIREIFKNNITKILITAPRRFGKSTSVNMLRKFVEIQTDKNGTEFTDERKKETPNYKIFQENSLLIFQDTSFFHHYFGTYPVIYINFNLVDGHNSYEILEKLQFALHESYNQHRYLLKSKILKLQKIRKLKNYYDYYWALSQIEVETGLKFLSECLYKHFNKKKVFLIIDDYDGPINNTMFKEDVDSHEINDLLGQIISHTLKDNTYIERAVLTGITCYSSIIHYGSTCIDPHTFLENHQFAPYYGITESELEYLLTKFQIDDQTQETIKLYYGYYLSLTDLHLYPIWSILHFLEKRKYENFWFKSVLYNEMNLGIINSTLNNLCQKENVTIEIYKNFEINHIEKFKSLCLEGLDDDDNEHNIKSLYLSILLSRGYLSYSSIREDESKICDIRIANNEIIKSLTL